MAQQYALLQSWFEQDEAAHSTVRSSTSKKKEQHEAVLRDLLPARRARWAELLAWTAKAAQDQVEEDEYIGFALVGRELPANAR